MLLGLTYRLLVLNKDFFSVPGANAAVNLLGLVRDTVVEICQHPVFDTLDETIDAQVDGWFRGVRPSVHEMSSPYDMHTDLPKWPHYEKNLLHHGAANTGKAEAWFTADVDRSREWPNVTDDQNQKFQGHVIFQSERASPPKECCDLLV